MIRKNRIGVKKLSVYGKLIGAFAPETEEEKMNQNIEKAKQQWKDAEKKFNEVVDYDLVDYTIYDMMAAKTRYAYLVKKAKEMGMR